MCLSAGQNKIDRLKLLNYNMKYHLHLLTRLDELRYGEAYNNSQESHDLAMFTRFFRGALEWKYRFWYLKLMNDFLLNKIEFDDFCEKFFQKSISIFEESDKLESELTLLTPSLNSFDFSYLIQEITHFSEYNYYDPKLYDIREKEEFRRLVQVTYLEILIIIS